MTEPPDPHGPLGVDHPATARCELCGVSPEPESNAENAESVVDLGNTDLSAARICLVCQGQGPPRSHDDRIEDPDITDPANCHFCGSDLWTDQEGISTPCWVPVDNADGTHIPACGSCAFDVSMIGVESDDGKQNPRAFRHCARCLILIDTPGRFEDAERDPMNAALMLLEESGDAKAKVILEREETSLCIACSETLLAKAEDYGRCEECKDVFAKDALADAADIKDTDRDLAIWINEEISQVCKDCTQDVIDHAKHCRDEVEDARRSGWDPFNDDEPMDDDD